MARGRFETIKELFRPTIVKVGGAALTALFAYDAASNQFDLPKLGKLVGMSGSLLPWWGWLLILQALFVYALFEYVRRIPAPAALPPGSTLGDLPDVKLSAELHEIRQTQRAIVDDYQRMLALDARFEEYKTKTNKRLAENEAHRSLDGDRNDVRFRSVYGALLAVWHRERLHFLGQQIAAGATELAAPTQQKATLDENQWELWVANEQAWRSAVSLWCELATAYVPAVDVTVFTTSDDHYKRKGEAQVGQFPDAEAYIAYKHFCAIWANWKGCQDEVQQAVHAAAFGGEQLPNHHPTLGALWLEAQKK